MSFDAQDPGTPASVWRQDERWSRAPLLTLDEVTGLLVLAAHPDDETLGAGGLVATARRRGIAVTVAIVTDGSAADPSLGAVERAALAGRRTREVREATAAIGVDELLLFGFADGRVREDRDAVSRLVESLVEAHPSFHLVAPWSGDGHRDHRVLGEIAESIASLHRRTLWSYPIWMWHWATPDDGRVPWPELRAFGLEPSERKAKSDALRAFPSQTEGHPPVLHERFLEHFTTQREMFVVPPEAT